MAEAKMCDICNAFYQPRYSRTITHIARVVTYDIDSNRIAGYDLCPDCVDAILGLIESRRSKEVNEDGEQ